MEYSSTFPPQVISEKRKTDTWKRECVEWAANHSYFNCASVREDIVRMKINYDLVNGVIHMEDIATVLNPGNVISAFVPDKIQHFPIINSKINTLRGEESSRAFEWHAIVTNPYAVSKIEEEKKKQLFSSINDIVENTDIDDQEADKQMQQTENYYKYNWQDLHEIQANELIKHYSKEQGWRRIFNDGFLDAMICSMEAYQCGIVGGEPFLVKLNPLKLRVFRSGRSNHIEDADVVIYEDYWSPGRICDTYYDELSAKDMKRITDELPDYGVGDSKGIYGNYNDANEFISSTRIYGEDGVIVDNNTGLGVVFDALPDALGGVGSSLLPYDIAGNIRVIHVWWKSKRKILKVESYNELTGEKEFDFYPETYVPDTDKGEKATPLWVNEAWEGTKIADDIYVGIRRCLVQHNSMSNPSRCHFGIVGTIYNINESAPYSLVDMMRPYNYLYDAVHAKLVDLIASNWGKLLELDLALKPKNWEVDKWMYFARANKTLIKDSFNEGSKGAATGKLAGGLNNASKGVIDADWGQSIQNYINLLQWIKDSMSDLVGINRQREGNTYNRETVGGIERAVLQSSYITDWLFQMHDDTKRRAMECFIEEAKVSMKGGSKKFQYIMSDTSRGIMNIDGDSFSECDYGIVVDSSSDTQKLYANIEQIGQAAMQRGAVTFSALMKLYSSASLNEKIRIIEDSEEKVMRLQQQQAEINQQLEMQKIQSERELKEAEMKQKDELNKRDNETRIRQAELGAQAEFLRLGIYENENNEELRREEMQIDKDKLAEEIREFDKQLRLKKDELSQKKEIEMAKIRAGKSNKK